ncbi:MAG: MerR family transcriptional regulator [Ruminococcaceae bacterium]|nr:MerR family transcriptional regulator [Oscillospiraceae bacterium]
MKINELARISHVNPETIRMYRNKGMLFPSQGENGYFEYSWDDLQNLLYIRKLRGLNLSLNTIARTYDRQDVEGIMADFRSEYDKLTSQLDELARQQFMLQVTMEHYQSYQKNMDGVLPVHVPDDRYDVLFEGEGAERLGMGDWLNNIDLFTQGMQIPEEYLRGERLPERVPVRLTIGTYRLILEGNGVAVPPEAVCVPRGLYLTARVERRGDTIDGRQLQSLLDYAREHTYALTGESTAFLFRVSRDRDGLCFSYRVRLRVAEEN